MEPILKEIVAQANGKYQLSNLLDLLDNLRRMKRIDPNTYESVYKRIINESRANDKWYSKYIVHTHVNFSFDAKTINDENDPKQINRIIPVPQVSHSTESFKRFGSPNMTPPTYESRYSKLSDYQMEHQKELTHQILRSVSEKRKNSEHSKSIQVSSYSNSYYQKGIDKMNSCLQRKILQFERFALNKLIFAVNEPTKIHKPKEPIDNSKQVEQFIHKRLISCLFNHFDNLKQYWIRQSQLHKAETKILAKRKTKYIHVAFTKLRNYSAKSRKQEFQLEQAKFKFQMNMFTKCWAIWQQFHQIKQSNSQRTRFVNKIVKKKQLKWVAQVFAIIKQYQQQQTHKKCNKILSNNLCRRKIQGRVFNHWRNSIRFDNQQLINRVILKQGFIQWLKYISQVHKQQQDLARAVKHSKQKQRRQVVNLLQQNCKLRKESQRFHKYLDDLHSIHQIKCVFKAMRIHVDQVIVKKRLNIKATRNRMRLYYVNPFNSLKEYSNKRKIQNELSSRVRQMHKAKRVYKIFKYLNKWSNDKCRHRHNDTMVLPQIQQMLQAYYFNNWKRQLTILYKFNRMAKIMKQMNSKCLIKQLKLITINFKQQHKYPIKLKKMVMASFHSMINKKNQKLHFKAQLLALHSLNIQRHIFKFMKTRGKEYHQKLISKRAVIRFKFGKYIAGPFYSWLRYKSQHKFKTNLHNNFLKLRFIRLYQKAFNALNDHKWRKKLANHQDVKNVPMIIKAKKLKLFRTWNAKLHSANKMWAFSRMFENLQLRTLFKHMKFIKTRDYQKRKLMQQGRLFFLKKRSFTHLLKFKNLKHKDQHNTELIQSRQIYRLKKASFTKIRTIFTVEQNIAYLTAYTILRIRKDMLKKYFEGFKSLIEFKKRPRDYILRKNKLQNCFNGWKTFTSKQQGIKLLQTTIISQQLRQKSNFIRLVNKQIRLSNVKDYYYQNQQKQVLMKWFQFTQQSQKVFYLCRLINQLKQKQTRKALCNLKQILKVNNAITNIRSSQLAKIFNQWRSRYMKLTSCKKLTTVLRDIQNQQKQQAIQQINQSSLIVKLQNKLNATLLRRCLKEFNCQVKKIQGIRKITNIISSNSINQLEQSFRLIYQCSKVSAFVERINFKKKQSLFLQWVSRKNNTKYLEIFAICLVDKIEASICRRKVKFVQNCRIVQCRKGQNDKLQLTIFNQWKKIPTENAKTRQFMDQMELVLSQKLYIKQQQQLFMYKLQQSQLQQLKGQVLLKVVTTFNITRQQQIFNTFKQDAEYGRIIEKMMTVRLLRYFTEWTKYAYQQFATRHLNNKLDQCYLSNMQSSFQTIQLFSDKPKQLQINSNLKLKKQSFIIWLKVSLKRNAARNIFNSLTQIYQSEPVERFQVQLFLSYGKTSLIQNTKCNKLVDSLAKVIQRYSLNCTKAIKNFGNSRVIRKKCQAQQRKLVLSKWYKQTQRRQSADKIFNRMEQVHRQQLFYDLAQFYSILDQNYKQLQNQQEIEMKSKNEAKLNILVQKYLKFNLIVCLKEMKDIVSVEQKLLSIADAHMNHQMLIRCFRQLKTHKIGKQQMRNTFNKLRQTTMRYHRRQYGVDLLKVLKLERKLQLKADVERNNSLLYSAFKEWKMISDERKMLKKYLLECEKDQRRGQSIPKHMPY